MSEIRLWVPPDREELRRLRAGEKVLLSGEMYTARDAAHKRMYELLLKGEKLPLDIGGACIYYVGPTPAPPGRVVGSAGPTTSSRMDKYTPLLIERGLAAMVGKGHRSQEVMDAIVKHGAVYFAATGGAGALLSKRIKESTVVAYEELGAEAIRLIKVEDFPVVVVLDTVGSNLYEIGPREYASTQN